MPDERVTRDRIVEALLDAAVTQHGLLLDGAVDALADAVMPFVVPAPSGEPICEQCDPEGCIVVERNGGTPCACRFDDDDKLVGRGCFYHCPPAPSGESRVEYRVVGANNMPTTYYGKPVEAASAACDHLNRVGHHPPYRVESRTVSTGPWTTEGDKP